MLSLLAMPVYMVSPFILNINKSIKEHMYALFKEGSRFNGLESCFNGFWCFSFSFAQNARLIFIEKTFFFPNRLFQKCSTQSLRKNSTLVIPKRTYFTALSTSAAVDPHLASAHPLPEAVLPGSPLSSGLGVFPRLALPFGALPFCFLHPNPSHSSN